MLKNGKWGVSSKIITGYVILFLCMGVSTFVLTDRISSLQREISSITEHDVQVNTLSAQIERHVLDMETGQRGYVITGDTQYLQPYYSGREKWLQAYNTLYQYLADSPARQKSLESIRANIEQWMAASGDRLIPMRRNGNSAGLEQHFRADPGKKYMDQIRAQWEHFRMVEQQQTAAHIADLNERNKTIKTELYAMLALALVFSAAGALMISRSVVRPLRQVTTTIQRITSAEGDVNERIVVRSNDEIKDLADATNAYVDSLQEQDWLKSVIADLATENQGLDDVAELARSMINKIASELGASYGVFYLRQGTGDLGRLKQIASYAADGDAESVGKPALRIGEGLVGQAALENRTFVLNELPESYINISSGLGQTVPRSIIITPIAFKGQVEAVIELATLEPLSEIHLQFMEQIRASFGVTINSVMSRMEIERLLSEAQAYADELQSQSEELQAQSEELLSQQEELKASNDSLKKSEERLQRQQEELEEANSELSKRSQQLEAQVRFAEEANAEFDRQRKALEQQAEELQATSRYKSEFLANMSHELRTPLNSMLILSQFLAENKQGNLTAKQVEFANTIHASGGDLLRLIDEILDLSKVEAGKLELQLDAAVLHEIGELLQRNFQPLAMKKGLELRLQVEAGVPPVVYTDGHRLLQILRNFLSNAIKFTEKGSVELRMYSASHDFAKSSGTLQPAVAFAVTDTGIGIPQDKSSLIFEAFQQVDGTTSRKYGGTGLGLTISRELAGLLGADIEMSSEPERGSTFTLYVPLSQSDSESPPAFHDEEVAATVEAPAPDTDVVPHISDIVLPTIELNDPELLTAGEVVDDRDSIEPGDKVILIIEDDVPFARFTLDIARSRGFKGLAATQGDKGLALVNAYKPDMVMLDIHLPVVDGWTVLDLIKRNPETRHIPVHVLTVLDEPQQSLISGAAAYLKKPISHEALDQAFVRMEAILSRSSKRLLIVEDNELMRSSLVELIDHDDVEIKAVGDGAEALQALDDTDFDCMVLDLELGDMSGFELLDRIRHNEKLRTLPIIIFTGKDLDLQQERELRKYAESIIIKNVKSQERLYAETALYLHRVESELPEDRRQMLSALHSADGGFDGKHILLVEDDIRNVFALTNVLEEHKLKVTYAENGREALSVLEAQPDIDLVLMDIMMPEMDGYEAMEHIRSNPLLERLPIIALTAKAMKEDRQKCIDAGASDYISKPINTDKLLSLLKVWLYK
ncbi:response regulator [Paenibacillus xerothermodurans]|uniref:Circadian input-output histidine kinase CikA n=1 Tax=Paenibacillus xerothermodurans TaxID=1977292 RepID=A0A2W1NWU6_PAEXE|nr:response regulator [Paenibacillus xerothermodurans]PZE20142.1 response regulator [Paenibacillus xerothermodurans]